MALSLVADGASEKRQQQTAIDGLLTAAAAAACSRRASTSSISSTSSSIAGRQPQDLSSSNGTNTVTQTPVPMINPRRRKLPEDYAEGNEDLELRDGRLFCRFCNVSIGPALVEEGDTMSSMSSRIREHMQSKKHAVQKQLQLLNIPTSNSSMGLFNFQQILQQQQENGGSGHVSQLASALKSAVGVIDAEMNDIDSRICQLQTQIDHLRSKKAKLNSHKSDINRSLSGVNANAGAHVTPVPPPQPQPQTTTTSQSNFNNALSALAFPPADLLSQNRNNEMLKELASSIQVSTIFNAMSALLNPQQQQQLQQQQLNCSSAKPLQSLISSVIDASQAEENSMPAENTCNDAKNTAGDNRLLCLSLAAAAVTPQSTDSASTSSGSGNGSRRKAMKPNRIWGGNTETGSTNSPTDLSSNNVVQPIFPNSDSPM